MDFRRGFLDYFIGGEFKGLLELRRCDRDKGERMTQLPNRLPTVS
jgi:hypothetical protein